MNIDQDERTTLDLSQAAKKVEMGTITVTVNPAGALIYVDGIEQPAGQSVIETTPGSHRIDVYLEGYERWGQTVEVGAQPLSLQVQLKKIAEVTPYFPPVPEEVPEKEQTPETGNCIVYTDPGWAKVYIDGDYVGVSPVMTSLPFGEHEIRAELNGERRKARPRARLPFHLGAAFSPGRAPAGDRGGTPHRMPPWPGRRRRAP